MVELSFVQGSLYHTVCRTADFLFQGGILPSADRDSLVALLLASTNRHKGFIFYPSRSDLEAGIRLITGEKPRTLLLANNAVELETLRLLALLRPDLPVVQQLFREADDRLEKLCFARVCLTGECAGASIAYLRYLAARGLEGHRQQIDHGLEMLKQDRAGSGKWRHFPYRFTQRWLAELPPELAEEELACSR